jgi:beta-lactam-binding protein with PASTA domain
MVFAALVAVGVSSGAAVAAHAPVHMPNLIGRTRVQVYRIMRDDGLYFVTSGPGASSERWDNVVAQSPRPGVLITWHGEAHLRVELGRPRGPRAVPRLVGRTRAEVYAEMRRAQLYFRTVGPGSSNGSWTIAVAQSPAAGTRVAWRSQVTLHVAIRRTRAKARPKARPKTRHTSPVRAATHVVSGAGYKIGVATWYNYFPGRCATWYLPKGTRIVVHDLTTGRSITCVITDREDHLGNHVVDLSETQFRELAPLWTGVISVKVTW